MRAWRLAAVAATALALGSGLTAWGLSAPASLSSTRQASTTPGGSRPRSAAASPRQAFPKVPGSSIITLQAAHGYTPKAPPGATDDYLPPRFVTWGDGSTDEMCLAILDWVR